MNATIAKLLELAKAAGTEIPDGLSAELSALSETLDAAPGQADAARAELLKAQREAKAAAKRAAELEAAAEAAKAGESEQVAALQAQLAEASKLAEQRAQALKQTKVDAAVRDAFADIADPKRRAAALKAFGTPDGVDLDDSGAVVGVQSAVEAFRGEFGDVFWGSGETPGPRGNGGPAAGQDPNPGGTPGDTKSALSRLAINAGLGRQTTPRA